MRLLVSVVLIWSISLCACSAATAQQTKIPAKHHPWGAFQPGAWKRVCVVTETLDENGFVKSTNAIETKTTLISIDEDGVTLEVGRIQEVAGKRFARDPEIIKQGFHGEVLGNDLKVKPSRPGQVVIEGRTLPCTIVQLECITPTGKTVTDVYYSAKVAPHILKRHGVISDLEGSGVLSDRTVNVVSLNWDHHQLPGIAETILVGAVKKHPQGTVITWAATSPKVPGGVVKQFSRELDKDRRLVRRSRLELITYGTEPEHERTGLFGRRRPIRYRKPLSTLRYPPR